MSLFLSQFVSSLRVGPVLHITLHFPNHQAQRFKQIMDLKWKINLPVQHVHFQRSSLSQFVRMRFQNAKQSSTFPLLLYLQDVVGAAEEPPPLFSADVLKHCGNGFQSEG